MQKKDIKDEKGLLVKNSKSEFRRYIFLLFGLIIGAVFDVFFYNKTMGITYPVFIIIILLLFLGIFASSLKKFNHWAWLFVLPIMLLSLTFFIFSNQILRTLNYLLIPILLMMFFSIVTKVNKYDWSDIRFVGDIVKRVFIPFRFIHRPFIELSEQDFSDKDLSLNKTGGDTENNYPKKPKGKTFTKVILGLLISIPLIALILWLLSSADIVFKEYFVNIPALKIFKHFLIIIVVAIYNASFAWTLVKAFKERKNYTPASNKINWKLFLDPVILITILVLINAIYLFFSFIQFKYLFGGASFVMPSSFTYAEYARRGFAELAVVSIINFALLIFGITFVKKDNKKFFVAVKSFLTILVASTFVILASAFYRMVVYENAYGFTYLRIFVQAFMVMVFFFFILSVIYIWYLKLSIIKSYIIAFLAVYIALNFINVDVLIAKNNIKRYFDTGKIDISYLNELSYDAIPQIYNFYNLVKNSEKLEEVKMAEQIKGYFEEKKFYLERDKSWQSFNISRHKAVVILDNDSTFKDGNIK
ncbi:MAG: DUF4173 domain-containing protein [Actinobacteria bacterium]|nr:DUF4173 domain-containing protein [Cyanobacteriota bacterium]MCL5772733.1 DUF4173 domain-containing protein [Actinomycetota bacterium]